jgi:outer membrane protein assembly factor BamB
VRPPSTPPRRSVLAACGSAGLTGLAGCLGAGGVVDDVRDRVDPHTHRSDAELGDPPEPWPTLGYDARRSGHRSTGTTLPEDPRTVRVAPAGEFASLPPVVADGVVYGSVERGTVTGTDGESEAFDEGFAGFFAVEATADDRFPERLRWRDPRETGVATPTAVGGTVLLTSAGATRALDCRTGALRWSYAAGFGGPNASPTAAGETVYVTDEYVFALDARTGERRWRGSGLRSWVTGTAATDEAVYVTAGDDGEAGLFALDPADGSRHWAADAVGKSDVPPIVGDETVLVTESDGRLRVVARDDGTERWSRRLGDGTQTAPAVADGTVYVMDEQFDGVLAFDARTGDRLWGRRLGPTIDLRPAVGTDGCTPSGTATTRTRTSSTRSTPGTAGSSVPCLCRSIPLPVRCLPTTRCTSGARTPERTPGTDCIGSHEVGPGTGRNRTGRRTTRELTRTGFRNPTSPRRRLRGAGCPRGLRDLRPTCRPTGPNRRWGTESSKTATDTRSGRADSRRSRRRPSRRSGRDSIRSGPLRRR